MPFKDRLKAVHQQAQAAAKARELAQTLAQKQQQEQEENSFAQAMKGVEPLKKGQGYYVAPPDRSPIKPRPKTETFDESQFFYVGEGTAVEIPATFSKNGQGSQDIKRLQSGHYEVVADVDLHGYTQEEAQQVLNEFIEFVKKRGVCGEIVHGSGLGSSGYTPVLKTLVRRWLMQHPDVLAYCEPRKGNDGAVRILIKRQRRPDPYAEQ